jgi:hypothetical protein
MGWETAIVLSVLGVSFFLVYLSTTFDPTDKWIQGFKVLLILVALVLVVLNSGIGIKLLEANNSSLGAANYNITANIHSGLTTNMFVIIWTFIFFMMLFVAYFLICLFRGSNTRGMDV